MKRKLMLGIALFVMFLKFFFSLNPGRIGVATGVIVFTIMFWTATAMWYLLEGALDENIE